MKIYFAPDTIARVSLIVLEEISLPYQAVKVSFAASEQRGADYLAVNPKGRVPSLETPQGVLTETPAILTYLAQTHPEAKLLPDDPFQAARVHELMSYLCSTVHVSHAHRMRGARWSDDPAVITGMKVKVAQNIADHFAYMEQRFVGPWAIGQAYTLADPYLFVIAGWIGFDGVDIARFPKIAEHQAAMRTRPAVQRALIAEE
jgi:glutathione S-transferase